MTRNKKDVIGIAVVIGIGLLILPGCAAQRARKEFSQEIRATVANAMLNNEPCSITCGKIKNVVERYRGKLK